jgi:D-alanyl-D-alanine carboxypeptidase
MKMKVLSLVAALATTGFLFAQIPDTDRIARLDSIMKAHIVHSGKQPVHNFLLYARNGENGLIAHLGTGTIGSSDTTISADYQYNVASITKTMVAVLILQLEEEGKLQLDDPALEYLQNSTQVTQPIHVMHDTDYSVRVTIRQLLQHTSGIADIFTDAATRFNISVLLHKNRSFDTKRIMDRYYQYKLNCKPFNKPGQGYHYSDINYMLLGFVVEEITGKSLPEAIRERILDKLGMQDTYFEFYEPERGHGKRIDSFLNRINMTQKINTSYEWGGGGIVSTTTDMAIFIEALFNMKLFRNPQTLSQMTDFSGTAKFGAHYGLGIYQYELNGKIFYGHGGFYGSILAYDPTEHITFSANIGQAVPPYDAGKLVESLMKIIMEPSVPNGSGIWETRWNLTGINGIMPDTTGSRPAYLILNRSEGRAQGSGHCNRFTGSFTTDGISTIRFGGLLSTKMACSGLEAESAFFGILEKTTGFRLEGDTLVLLGANSEVLATFSH